MQDWYKIKNINKVDSPALVVYSDKVQENINRAIHIAGDITKLRPHVKTNKMSEVCKMMLNSGITKFKCATIAEAEMLSRIGAPDILLAYQPVGPKIFRLIELAKTYPRSKFSCLVDNPDNTKKISDRCGENNLVMDVYIDLNIGMNRTGIKPENALELVREIKNYPNIRIVGLHGYDGHIHDEDIAIRQQNADLSFLLTEQVFKDISPLFDYPLVMIMGGTPTFPTHAGRHDSECSPGTFVFWDWGYKHLLPDLPFEYAALLVTRIISIIDEHHICVDLGHKSIAAENPLPRVFFLNLPEAKSISQSEEHLVLEVPDSGKQIIGMELYGVPVHICPTVALYERAFIIRNNEYTKQWKIEARDRIINL